MDKLDDFRKPHIMIYQKKKNKLTDKYSGNASPTITAVHQFAIIFCKYRFMF